MTQSDKQPASTVWPTIAFAVAMAILAGFQRYYPHPFNLTLIGALALWGGARLSPWLGLTLPLAVWGITDLLEWAIKEQTSFNLYVLASFLLYGLLGLTLRKSNSPTRIGATCVLGTVQFFLITNFSVWAALSVNPSEIPNGAAMVEEQQGQYKVPMYARNLEGLITCYAMGLPFSNPEAPPLGYFGNALVGDLTFTALLFILHAALLSVVVGRDQLQPVRERVS